MRIQTYEVPDGDADLLSLGHIIVETMGPPEDERIAVVEAGHKGVFMPTGPGRRISIGRLRAAEQLSRRYSAARKYLEKWGDPVAALRSLRPSLRVDFIVLPSGQGIVRVANDGEPWGKSYPVYGKEIEGDKAVARVARALVRAWFVEGRHREAA